MPYFEKLLELLKLEREEDRQNYRQLIQTSSVAERRASGLAWYPVIIKGSEPARGDYIAVEIGRTTSADQVHYFRSGSAVTFFSNHNPAINRVDGIVTYQSDDRLKLTLYTDELPDWVKEGKLGIDLLFDERTYEEMESALREALRRAENKRESHLIDVLTGKNDASFENDADEVPFIGLNLFQQAAVHKIMAARDLAVVHGPPGTGKTTTLVQAIKALVNKTGEQVLVTAPSNAAVDLLSEKLADEGLRVIRIGNPERVSDQLVHLTLDDQIAGDSRNKEIKRLKKQAAEYKNLAHKYKRNFGKAEREQRKALFNEAHQVMAEADRLERFIADDLLAKAHVLTATLVGSNHYTIKDRQFKTVFIDEAAQALEPAAWIPILKAQRVVLAGDHFQLPPTIKSQQAAKEGLAVTLLEKCVQRHPESVVLLAEQYRMNEQIMAFSSNEFYEGKLKANSSVANRLLFPPDEPLLFIDTAGCGFEEQLEGTSTFNSDEAHFLYRHLSAIVEKLDECYAEDNFPSIAVISPYQEQIRVLREGRKDYPGLVNYPGQLSVNTIDSFQGQERDIVYLSMTRSNTAGEIGFLADIRRMNVAMTRARKKLVVIGDSSTLGQLEFYKHFIDYTESIGAYRSAWEYGSD